jgi:hypothetical protein
VSVRIYKSMVSAALGNLRLRPRQRAGLTMGASCVINAASHDLRQPLNTMGLYAPAPAGAEPRPWHFLPHQRCAVNNSVGCCSHCSITSPDPTRRRAGREVFALRPLLSDGTMRPAATIKLQLQCGPLRDPVTERVLHLLSNALRHARNAVYVWLHAQFGWGVVQLEVGDDGQGLNRKNEPSL